ncbi:F-box domain [Dillenia turbinata]|uniref:F-box domain n=1 Tax=Dillenia turbinata TaxID=194707 RepID=A0AAN8W7Z3_9MAGN
MPKNTHKKGKATASDVKASKSTGTKGEKASASGSTESKPLIICSRCQDGKNHGTHARLLEHIDAEHPIKHDESKPKKKVYVAFKGNAKAKESSGELYEVNIAFRGESWEIQDIEVLRLDCSRMLWEEEKSLKSKAFFWDMIDLPRVQQNQRLEYRKEDRVDAKAEEKRHNRRVQEKEVTAGASGKSEEAEGSLLLLLPPEILELVFKHLNAIDYIHFRSTCKNLHSVAPPLKWRTRLMGSKMQTSTPWFAYFKIDGTNLNVIDPLYNVNFSCWPPDEDFVFIIISDIGFHEIEVSYLREGEGWNSISIKNKIIRFEGNNCVREVLTKLEKPSKSIHSCFILECDGELLSVFVGKFGKWVKVFGLNFAAMPWVRVQDLGKYTLFVNNVFSFYFPRLSPGTENRIYFPRLSCENENVVFYSLQTGKFLSFGCEVLKDDLCSELTLLAIMYSI